MPEKQDFLTYKNRPLVRSGNTIYYGNMTDKFVIKMDIKSTKKQDDLDIADKVAVSLVHTDDKSGLYEALDLGAIWLERALSE